jgi:hypothetical protein
VQEFRKKLEQCGQHNTPLPKRHYNIV